jgi:hypothetical protein
MHPNVSEPVGNGSMDRFQVPTRLRIPLGFPFLDPSCSINMLMRTDALLVKSSTVSISISGGIPVFPLESPLIRGTLGILRALLGGTGHMHLKRPRTRASALDGYLSRI